MSENENTIPENIAKLRLTKDFIPSHYDIFFDIDIINLSYTSKVEIIINSTIDNPKYISLNSISCSNESKLTNYELIKLDNNLNYINKYLSLCPEDYHKSKSTIYFSLKEGIKKGDKLIFKCEKKDLIKTSTDGYGLYISFWDYKLRRTLDNKTFNKNNIKDKFKDKQNPTVEEIQNNFNYFKSLVITLNSSPSGLREVIPCFDEPFFKSTFKLSISVNKNFVNSSKNFTIVNNSDLDKIIKKENKSIFIFKETPKISTYLLTFVIGYYEYIEKYMTKINNEQLRLRVYGPENQMDKVDFCLNISEDAINKFEKMINYPFYMDKIDSIFVPNLNFTAMEFLGCVVYKQEIMIDKNNTTAFMYRNSIRDVYHELFHNWIGNLVTMEFFDNTWLNEGITKFFEIYITLSPEKYAYFCDIMRLSYFYALSWKNHALNNKLLDSEESIRTNFDTTTYEKGGYIMNMLLQYFGKEKLFQWLNLYCNKYKFSNVNENDFFETMGEVYNYDIKNFLREWIYEINIPILTASFSEEKDTLIIKQSPNFENKKMIFKIPLFIKTKNLEKKFLMNEETLIIKLSDLNLTYDDINNNSNFIVINSDIKSFCLVKYLDEILKNAIFYFYNNLNENKDLNINKVSDADIFQIYIIYIVYKYNENNFINDIKKMKRKTKNFEILNLIYYIFNNRFKKINPLFYENENKLNKEYNDKIYELLYELIDYNDSNLLNKILEKFDTPTNDEKEDESGQIEYEKFFILILCLYKRDENIIKKIYHIYKKNNFNLYKINKTYRSVLPLILVEFIYLFPEKEKIVIYKSISKYYEEMYYYFYFADKENYEKALNNLNNGISDEIFDYYFENYDIIGNKELLNVDSNIVDYFFKYIKKLYEKEKKDDMKFEDYLYDICLEKKFNINDNKLKNIYDCYSFFIKKYPYSLDKNILRKYCEIKYLNFKEVKDNYKVDEIKKVLLLY